MNVFHILQIPGIKQILLNDGIIRKRNQSVYSCTNPQYEWEIDYSRCSPEDWQRMRKALVNHGAADYVHIITAHPKRNRRDLTPEEIRSFQFSPVAVEDDNSVTWEADFVENDNPAFFISRKLGNTPVLYTVIYDGEKEETYAVKNGVFSHT